MQSTTTSDRQSIRAELDADARRRLAKRRARRVLFWTLVALAAVAVLVNAWLLAEWYRRARLVPRWRADVVSAATEPERTAALLALVASGAPYSDDLPELLIGAALDPSQPSWVAGWADERAAELPVAPRARFARLFWASAADLRRRQRIAWHMVGTEAGPECEQALADAAFGAYGHDLRASAAGLLASPHGGWFLKWRDPLAPLLDDPDAQVRAAVVAGYLNKGGPWRAKGEQTLRELIESSDRFAAAVAIRSSFYQALWDRSPGVAGGQPDLRSPARLALASPRATTRLEMLSVIAGDDPSQGQIDLARELHGEIRRLALGDPDLRVRAEAGKALVAADLVGHGDRVLAMAIATSKGKIELVVSMRSHCFWPLLGGRVERVPGIMRDLHRQDPRLAAAFANAVLGLANPITSPRHSEAIAGLFIAFDDELLPPWRDAWRPSFPPAGESLVELILGPLPGGARRPDAKLLAAVASERDAPYAKRIAAEIDANNNFIVRADLARALARIGAASEPALPSIRAAMAIERDPKRLAIYRDSIREIESAAAAISP